MAVAHVGVILLSSLWQEHQMLIIYFSPEEVRHYINSRWLHFHGSGAQAHSSLTSAQEGRLDHCDCRSEPQPRETSNNGVLVVIETQRGMIKSQLCLADDCKNILSSSK